MVKGVTHVLINLKAEMCRRNLTAKDVGAIIQKSDKTTRDKINGKSGFSVEEALKTRDALFPGLDIEYLFANFSGPLSAAPNLITPHSSAQA